MNNCNSTRYVVSSNTCWCNSNLPHSANYSQQNLTTFQARSFILSRDFRRNFHHIRNINTSISKVVDTDDWYTAAGLRTWLNDAVSY